MSPVSCGSKHTGHKAAWTSLSRFHLQNTTYRVQPMRANTAKTCLAVLLLARHTVFILYRHRWDGQLWRRKTLQPLTLWCTVLLLISPTMKHVLLILLRSCILLCSSILVKHSQSQLFFSTSLNPVLFTSMFTSCSSSSLPVSKCVISPPDDQNGVKPSVGFRRRSW